MLATLVFALALGKACLAHGDHGDHGQKPIVDEKGDSTIRATTASESTSTSRGPHRLYPFLDHRHLIASSLAAWTTPPPSIFKPDYGR